MSESNSSEEYSREQDDLSPEVVTAITNKCRQGWRHNDRWTCPLTSLAVCNDCDAIASAYTRGRTCRECGKLPPQLCSRFNGSNLLSALTGHVFGTHDSQHTLIRVELIQAHGQEMARDPASAVHLPPQAQPTAAQLHAESSNVHSIEDQLTACLPSDPLSQGPGKWRCGVCSSGPGFKLKTLADCYAHGKSKRDSQHDRLVELLEQKYGKSKCMPVSQQQAQKSRSIVAAYDPKSEGAAHILFPPT